MPDFISVLGCRIELTRTGEGPPILFLHAGDGVDPARRLISQMAKKFEVIAPSHPGFDGSDLPSHFSTVDDLAYHYMTLMEQLDLYDLSIVGCSLGAWIGAEIAIKSSARIRSLTFINPIGAKFDGREERQLADVFYYSHRDRRSLLYADGLSDDRDFALMSEDDVFRFVRNCESFTLFGWSPLLHDPKLRYRLMRIKIPTRVISGTFDRVALPPYALAFSEHLLDCEFRSIANVGHYAHDEIPEDLADIVWEAFNRKKG